MEPITRVCKKCGEEKLLEEFIKVKSCKYGHGHTCKVCANTRFRKHKSKNEQHYKDYFIKYYLNNRDYINKQQREYQNNNKEYINKQQREYQKKYRINNKEYLNKRSKEYRNNNNNRDYINKQQREYRKGLPDSYCSDQLIQRIKGIGCKLTSKDIPQELIELKRVQLQIHRLTKTN